MKLSIHSHTGKPSSQFEIRLPTRTWLHSQTGTLPMKFETFGMRIRNVTAHFDIWCENNSHHELEIRCWSSQVSAVIHELDIWHKIIHELQVRSDFTYCADLRWHSEIRRLYSSYKSKLGFTQVWYMVWNSQTKHCRTDFRIRLPTQLDTWYGSPNVAFSTKLHIYGKVS
jgi:hypothetical protein